MTKLTRFILAGALALLVTPASAQQAQIRPQQAQVLREAQIATTAPVQTPVEQPTSSVVLAAVSPWSPANVDVKAGSTLQIRAEGRWSVNNGQQMARASAQVPYTGPDGYPETGNLDGLIMPGVNRGALIGKIGENGKPFLIGSSYQGTTDADGPLFVSMNEVADQFQDNAGRVGISITVAPPPTENATPETPTVTTVPDDTVTVAIPPGTGFQPAPPTAEPAIPQNIINIALIVAAVFAGLMLLSALAKPRPRVSPDRDREKRDPPSGNVAARVADNGVAGQSLTISVRH